MEKHGEFMGDFLNKGYDVYAYDHRGQGLSDRPLENPRKSHINDFDVFVQDLAYIIDHKILAEKLEEKDDSPLHLIAHSMGGNISFRYLHDYPDRVDKAVLLGPFLGIKFPNMFLKVFIKYLVRILSFMGFSNFFAFGQTEYKTTLQRKLSRLDLTHDKERYERETRILKEQPKLYVGGVTFEWVKAAMISMDIVKKPEYAAEIKTKLLFILAEEEKVVDNRKAREIVKKLPAAKMTIIKGARHEIYRETDEIRAKMWSEIEKFFK
jgi:lysophospholipase